MAKKCCGKWRKKGKFCSSCPIPKAKRIASKDNHPKVKKSDQVEKTSKKGKKKHKKDSKKKDVKKKDKKKKSEHKKSSKKNKKK